MSGELVLKVFKEFEKLGIGEMVVALEAGPNDVDFKENPPTIMVASFKKKLTDHEIEKYIEDEECIGTFISVNTSRESRTFRFGFDKAKRFKKDKNEVTERITWVLAVPTEDWRDYYSYKIIPVLIQKNSLVEAIISLPPIKPGRLNDTNNYKYTKKNASPINIE